MKDQQVTLYVCPYGTACIGPDCEMAYRHTPPCCGSFPETGEHGEGCRTPIYAKLANDRKARNESPFQEHECSRCGNRMCGDQSDAADRIVKAAAVMVRLYEHTCNCHTVEGGRKHGCQRCGAADELAAAIGIERRDAKPGEPFRV